MFSVSPRFHFVLLRLCCHLVTFLYNYACYEIRSLVSVITAFVLVVSVGLGIHFPYS
jgi:hypothetical protein